MGSQQLNLSVKTEVGEWIDQNWDPELTVAQWWQLMADARLSHTMPGEEAGGRGWSRALNHVALSVMADKAVLGTTDRTRYDARSSYDCHTRYR